MNNHSQIAKHDYLRSSGARVSGTSVDLSDSGIFVLLQQCLKVSRDELLWTEFIRRSQPVIAGVVIRTVRHWSRPAPALVDDLVQETYLKLFGNNARALRHFVCHHENALYGFLKVVASNVVQDHFRSIYSQKRGSGREEESLDQANETTGASGGMAPAGAFKTIRAAASTAHAVASSRRPRSATAISQAYEGLERSILLRQIDAYLKTLAHEPTFARDYAIFWLYYKEGLTAKAIAGFAWVGLSVKGVESTLLRLTRLVRRQLDPVCRRLPTNH
jgi:RNA polymerase sigma factor (sigma-70 family)